MADLYFSQEMYEECIETSDYVEQLLGEIERTGPDKILYPLALQSKGRCYLRLKKVKEAIDCFERCLLAAEEGIGKESEFYKKVASTLTDLLKFKASRFRGSKEMFEGLVAFGRMYRPNKNKEIEEMRSQKSIKRLIRPESGTRQLYTSAEDKLAAERRLIEAYRDVRANRLKQLIPKRSKPIDNLIQGPKQSQNDRIMKTADERPRRVDSALRQPVRQFNKPDPPPKVSALPQLKPPRQMLRQLKTRKPLQNPQKSIFATEDPREKLPPIRSANTERRNSLSKSPSVRRAKSIPTAPPAHKPRLHYIPKKEPSKDRTAQIRLDQDWDNISLKQELELIRADDREMARRMGGWIIKRDDGTVVMPVGEIKLCWKPGFRLDDFDKRRVKERGVRSVEKRVSVVDKGRDRSAKKEDSKAELYNIIDPEDF